MRVKLSWCESRVISLKADSQFTIQQEGNAWKWSSAQNTGVANFIEVEKWLANYCNINIVDVAQGIVGALEPVLRVTFVKGEQAELLRSANGIYSWKSHTFRSAKLDKAMHELTSLAQ